MEGDIGSDKDVVVIAHVRVPTLVHKVCDQLINFFVSAVAHESLLLMQQQ